MKLLTLQFLTCAIKACKSHASSFPLHPTDCTLSRTDMPFSAQFLINLLPRLDFAAIRTFAADLGLEMMVPEERDLEPVQVGEGEGGSSDGGGDQVGIKEKEEKREDALKKLHTLVMETEIQEGKLKCGNCGFEYGVKEGVANFLLPPHLV